MTGFNLHSLWCAKRKAIQATGGDKWQSEKGGPTHHAPIRGPGAAALHVDSPQQFRGRHPRLCRGPLLQEPRHLGRQGFQQHCPSTGLLTPCDGLADAQWGVRLDPLAAEDLQVPGQLTVSALELLPNDCTGGELVLPVNDVVLAGGCGRQGTTGSNVQGFRNRVTKTMMTAKQVEQDTSLVYHETENNMHMKPATMHMLESIGDAHSGPGQW